MPTSITLNLLQCSAIAGEQDNRLSYPPKAIYITNTAQGKSRDSSICMWLSRPVAIVNVQGILV